MFKKMQERIFIVSRASAYNHLYFFSFISMLFGDII